jgi:response regulator RpfG family c-di-GMP phosphodiesterase/serine/threonine protein kinase
MHDPSSAKMAGAAAPRPRLPGPAQAFLDRLRPLRLLDTVAIDDFLAARSGWLAEYDHADRFGHALVQAGLLSQYQLDRVRAGTTHGLVLGAYRVLEELGSGGMAMVFCAEHALLKRRVAVKVMPADDDYPPALRRRFYAEMRVLADLHHEHVVLAYDAGEVEAAGPGLPPLIYLVMELVEGGDLDRYVRLHGPRPVAEACEYIRQAASGLQAAHDRHLIHRDVKPSNLLRTTAGRIKLVDFGLARQFCSRLTDPRALLGSVEFMPPEQSHDPSFVGTEADVYGLGATLFWLLTGQAPYPDAPSPAAALRALQTDRPRRLRDLLPDAPEALDDLIDRMLDRNPLRRPQSPFAVMSALAPFASGVPSSEWRMPREECPQQVNLEPGASVSPQATRHTPHATRRALIVDDNPSVRMVHRLQLESLGCDCTEAGDGPGAVAAALGAPLDLVLLDLNLPGMDGLEACRLLREAAGGSPLKIIVVSGRGDQNTLAEVLAHGADDYVAKPYGPSQLAAKVQAAFRLRDAQARVALLADQLLGANRQLEQSLQARAADVRKAHDALLFALAKVAESRDGETPGHLRRMQLYTRLLAGEAAAQPPWSGLVDDRFLDELHRCVPLHDIGKIGLPDDVLLKPAALNAAERRLVETHPLIGDRILESLAREHGASLGFLGMARAIVRSHHERMDGRGYPDGLSGDAIPAAARLTAVADVYDALRRERLHKRAMSHDEAMRVVMTRSPGQFDPSLLSWLAVCRDGFERVYREVCD